MGQNDTTMAEYVAWELMEHVPRSYPVLRQKSPNQSDHTVGGQNIPPSASLNEIVFSDFLSFPAGFVLRDLQK